MAGGVAVWTGGVGESRALGSGSGESPAAKAKRVLITPLKPSRVPSLELTYTRGSYYRPYRDNDELRIAHATLVHKATGRSLEVGALLVRRAHRDVDTVLLTTGLALGMEGHDTYEAANGALGAELARHVHPDIALIDIGLPDLSGYEVARRIRADLNGDVTLVAVTGYGQPEDQRRAFDAGFDAHLVKPVTVEQLNETLFAIRPPAPLAASASD